MINLVDSCWRRQVGFRPQSGIWRPLKHNETFPNIVTWSGCNGKGFSVNQEVIALNVQEMSMTAI